MHGIEALIAQYGLIAVALGTFVEGETVLAVAGLAAHQHLLNPVAVTLAGFCGAFVADQMVFHLARRNARHPWVVLLAGSRAGRVALGRVAARPNGFSVAFRFIPGLRTVGPVAIALAGVSPGRFAGLDALASAVWAGVYTALGYGVSRGVERAFGDLTRGDQYAVAAAGVAVIVICSVFAIRRHILRDPAD